jgi:lysozyme
MKLTPAGTALIKQHEKCKLVAYLPTKKDKPTIGWGHCGPEVQLGETITQAQADALLDTDLLWADACVRKTCPDATPGQHSAMVSLCFNIGAAQFAGGGKFKPSSVCRLHKAGRYPEAAQSFALWNKQAGQILGELVHRRAEEAAMYLADTPAPKADLVDVGGKADGEKPLSQSRAVNGNALVGSTTALGLGGKLVEHTHPDALQQLVDALGPIAPYASWIGTAIVLATLAGVAMSLYARWHDRHTGRA